MSKWAKTVCPECGRLVGIRPVDRRMRTHKRYVGLRAPACSGAPLPLRKEKDGKLHAAL